MASKSHIVDQTQKKRYCAGGCRISQEEISLPKFGASQVKIKDLPPSVDLRQLMTPVEDQSQTNTCVANALAGAYEFLIMKNHRKHIDVSRLFIYYNARKERGVDDDTICDDGCSVTDAIKALRRHGCCKEDLFEFNFQNLNQKPPIDCYNEAHHYRIQTAMKVETDLNQMKACLAEGFPFAFGLITYVSFHEAKYNGGRVSMPNISQESKNVEHEAHAMLAVGYSDLSRCFFVRNSWGESWGDKGYCYIPYEYMSNPGLCLDLHTIKVVTERSNQPKEQDIKIVNQYDWTKNVNKSLCIPSDYKADYFNNEFFWKLNEQFNYMHDMQVHDKAQSNILDQFVQEGYNDKSFILWIDEKNQDNALIEKHLKAKKNIIIDFCITYIHAIRHLMRYKNKIKSSTSMFQIISRGYYANVNKNPLNLLQLLDDYQLSHIPILVYTRHKLDVENRFQIQAPSIGIHDWKKNMFITDKPDELIMKVLKNINDYC